MTESRLWDGWYAWNLNTDEIRPCRDMDGHIRFGAKMRLAMSLATFGIVIDTPNGEQAKVSFTPAAIREMHRICGVYLAKHAEQEAADGVDK